MKSSVFTLALVAAPAMTYAQEFPVRRCMNLGAALEAPFEGDWGYVIERNHVARIAAAGFDTVRLPVKFSAHWDGSGFDPALLARVDEVIGWAEAEDLFIIIDLHHFWELNEDPAAHGAVLVAMWRTLSDHFAGASDRVIFELLNEPEGKLTTAMAVDLYQQIIPDLRQDHPSRWIITGGDGWNDIDQMLAMPPAGAFEARTFHYYVPWQFTHQQAAYMDQPPPPRTWGTKADRDVLAADFSRAAAAAAPVFLGEFGVYDATDLNQKLRWVTAVRQEAESHDFAWCYWGFTQGGQDGFSAFDTNANNWIPGILAALTE